jgi:hypothetical protein
MPKPLVVTFRGRDLPLDFEKVDRSKLYGYVDTETVDDTGKPCELGTLLGDGHSLVGKGGTGLAYVSQDGLWLTKSQLRPVDRDGQPITPVKSTFDAPVPLSDTATIDEYLSHNIHLVYMLSATDGLDEAFLAELKSGTIYQFPFSYRGGVTASAGFLLLGADGNPFLCVGTPTLVEYVGLKAAAPAVSDLEVADSADDDAMDFNLV